jgi:hypothetical protein
MEHDRMERGALREATVCADCDDRQDHEGWEKAVVEGNCVEVDRTKEEATMWIECELTAHVRGADVDPIV